jgi:hypothetical protein
MTFDEWMRSKFWSYQPTDDDLKTQLFRKCWHAAVTAERERYAAQEESSRQPLSDEQIMDCFQQRHQDKATQRRMIARAVERAHGIGDKE